MAAFREKFPSRWNQFYQEKLHWRRNNQFVTIFQSLASLPSKVICREEDNLQLYNRLVSMRLFSSEPLRSTARKRGVFERLPVNAATRSDVLTPVIGSG